MILKYKPIIYLISFPEVLISIPETNNFFSFSQHEPGLKIKIEHWYGSMQYAKAFPLSQSDALARDRNHPERYIFSYSLFVSAHN